MELAATLFWSYSINEVRGYKISKRLIDLGGYRTSVSSKYIQYSQLSTIIPSQVLPSLVQSMGLSVK